MNWHQLCSRGHCCITDIKVALWLIGLAANSQEILWFQANKHFPGFFIAWRHSGKAPDELYVENLYSWGSSVIGKIWSWQFHRLIGRSHRQTMQGAIFISCVSLLTPTELARISFTEKSAQVYVSHWKQGTQKAQAPSSVVETLKYLPCEAGGVPTARLPMLCRAKSWGCLACWGTRGVMNIPSAWSWSSLCHCGPQQGPQRGAIDEGGCVGTCGP